MSLDPRDLHNLLPPDLVAAVEDADFIARARIENSRVVEQVDTLRDDVRALATLVRIRKTVADFVIRHGDHLPSTSPPDDHTPDGTAAQTLSFDGSDTSVRDRSEAKISRLGSEPSKDDVCSTKRQTDALPALPSTESLLSPFLSRELVKQRRELRAAMSAHLTTASLKRPPLFAADVDRLSRFVSLHLTLAETALAHARAGGDPETAGLDAWAALALDLPGPPAKKLDRYLEAVRAAEAAGFVEYSKDIHTTDLDSLRPAPGGRPIASFDFDPEPDPESKKLDAFDPEEALRRIEQTESVLDSLRPSRDTRTIPHVVWPAIPADPSPDASPRAGDPASGRTGANAAPPSLSILRPLDYFPDSIPRILGLESLRRAAGNATSRLGKFHLHHEVTDRLFNLLGHLRRSLRVASRPRGLPPELLDAPDGPPLTEEQFWAEEAAFARPP